MKMQISHRLISWPICSYSIIHKVIFFVSRSAGRPLQAGRKREADAQYALVEQIGRLSALNGALYNRQLALFYADHDVKAEEAYRLAFAATSTGQTPWLGRR